jgi:GAF domain-containing protein/ActR/RegA family two-component response regulator
VAGIWTGGAVLLLRQIDARHDALIDVIVERVASAVHEQQTALLREATLLSQDPAVIEGTHKGDWATLVRGAARLRALTLERVADVVVVQDIGGAPLLQVPPTPPLSLPAFGPPAKVRATFASLGGRTYLLAVAAIGGEPGAGVVVVGRRVERLDPQLGGGTGLVVVNGDTLRFSTLPEAPTEGWAASTAAGERVVAGEPWRFGNVGRLGGDVAWAAVRFSDAAAERRAAARALAAGGGLMTLAAALLVALLTQRTRSASGGAGARPPAAVTATVAAPGRSALRTVSGSSRELQALYATALAVATGTELESTATQTLDLLCTVARVDVGMVYRVDRASARLVLVAHHGIPARYLEFLRTRDIGRTRIGEVARTGEHSLVELDPTRIRDATLREAVATEGYRTQLALPIPVQGATWGVMTLVSRARRRFDADELMLPRAAAHQLGLAVGRAALIGELRLKSRRLEALTRVAARLATTVPQAELLQRVTDGAREMFDAAVARLWLVDDDGLTLSVGASAGADVAGAAEPMPIGEGLVGRVVAARAPLAIADVTNDPRPLNAEPMRTLGLAAFAGVPLIVGDRVLGALAIGLTERYEYSTEELDVFASLGNQAAVAIENRRLFESERMRGEHVAALLDINTKIGTMISTEALLASVAEEAARLLDVDNAGFRLRQGDELVVAGLAGTARETMKRERIGLNESISGKVFATGRSLILDDIAAFPDVIAEHMAADRALGYTTFLGVPLTMGDRTIGVLTFRARRRFSARDRELAEAFAGQAAIALEHARLVREASEQTERMRALAELSRVFAGTLDPDVVSQRIADCVRSLFASVSASLFRVDPGNGDLVPVATSTGRTGNVPPAPVLPRGVGISGLAAESRRVVSSADVFADPHIEKTDALRAWVAAVGHYSAIAVPLIVNDIVVGVLTVSGERGRVFGDADARLAQTFADQAALALANARLYAESTQRRAEAEELARLARTLTESLDVSEVAQRTVDSVLPLFRAQSSVVRLLQPDGSLAALALGGSSRERFDAGHVLPPGVGVLGRAVVEGRAVTTPDALTDEATRVSDDLATDFRVSGDVAVLAVPMRAKGMIIGALGVADRRGRVFTDGEAALLQAFADQATLALENARMFSAERSRRQHLAALAEIERELAAVLDAERLPALIVERATGLFEASGALWTLEEDGTLIPRAWTGQDLAGERLGPGEGLAGVAISERRGVITNDYARSPHATPRFVSAGLRRVIMQPVILRDRPLGILTMSRAGIDPAPFDAEDLALLQSLAAHSATALENTRLFTEARERLRETTTLLAVGRVLSQPDAGSDLMRRVAAEVARAFGADMVGAYLLDERREQLIAVGGYHVPKDLLRFLSERPIVLERFAWLLDGWRAGRAATSANPHDDPRFDRSWQSALPPHSVLFVPTLAHGEPVGGLFLVWWRTGRRFEPAEIRLVEGVAAQVGLAMENGELARQTQRKLAETQTLLSVSRALSSTLDFQPLLRHFLRAVARTLGADCVGAWLVDADGEWMEPVAGYHIPPERLADFREMRLSLLKHAFYAEAARTRRPVFTSDAPNDSRLPPIVRERGSHRTQLFVPVVINDRMIAAFAAVWWETARSFSDDEIALMEAIANQAGVALENGRLFEENRQRLEELSVLHDLSRAVTGQLDRGAIVEAVRRHVARVLDARNMVVILRDPDREELEIVLRVTDGVDDLHEPRRYPVGDIGLMSVVLATSRPVHTDDYAAECVRHGVAPIAGSANLRHWLGVPMTVGERVLGVIVLRGGQRPFGDSDERLLLNIAHLAALALRSVRLFEERSRAYGELAAAQDQLVRTEKLRALGEMASGVAHDFNNLLASVLGRAQLLMRRVQDPQQLQWLRVIERSALDGAQTVRRLQEFTRIRRDQPMVPLDVTQIVRDALDITQSRWREEPVSRGIVIDVRTRLDPAPPVLGDASELREALTNLILNAVDAMPAGGTLTLTTRAADDHVDVIIADTGVGIPADARDKVFDPFFTTKGPKGTGLGLSMTYGIVSRHGGFITVDSEEGRGSTFKLSFPSAATVEPVPAPAPHVVIGPVRALRCLVVDDEEPVRAMLADAVESAGHRATVVEGGAEAIARFRAEPFDVVLTDLAMPRVSGWQVARAVKQIAPRVPVLLITGFGVELSSEERRAHGVDVVLVKPLQIQEILDALAEVARNAPPTPAEDNRWPFSI